MFKTRLLFLLLVMAAGLAVADEAEPEKAATAIEWQAYNAAMADGRDNGKPVFLHFTASWCKWCQKMRKETYQDQRVIEYLDAHFASAWVDTEKYKSLARQYEINALPTLWFLDEKGKGLTAVDGYMTADKLLSLLKFIQTKSYEHMSFDKWTKHHLDEDH